MATHRAFQMYAHITWHTWERVGCIDTIAAYEIRVTAMRAGKLTGVQVLRAAVLADHVHFVVSFRPDTRLSDFVRLVKSSSAMNANRRIPGALRWCRGCYVATVHKNDLPRLQRYVDRQFDHHPDRIPRDLLPRGRLSNPGRQPGVNEHTVLCPTCKPGMNGPSRI